MPRSQLAAILAVVAVLGFLFALQVRSEATAQLYLTGQDNVTLGLLITGLSQANNRLLLARVDLSDREAKLQADLNSAGGSPDALRAELFQLQVVNGVVPVHGPGIELTVGFNLHAFDLQDLTNILRQIGAEAIAVNGHRVTARTVIAEANGKLLIDGNPVSAPLRVDAIGDPQALDDGAQSIVASLSPRGSTGLLQVPAIHIAAVAPDRPVVYSSFPQ
jgi:uncharacterized protein YlxW (UPF0749 family)